MLNDAWMQEKSVIIFSPVKGTWSKFGTRFCVSALFDPMTEDWKGTMYWTSAKNFLLDTTDREDHYSLFLGLQITQYLVTHAVTPAQRKQAEKLLNFALKSSTTEMSSYRGVTSE
jgi:hypothetical protein